ncbi:Crp/Fnr family transcriptional regulator [Sphingomonas sp. PB1R3]|uniref:Crp/Fnr family transcriptional regulator n=1 Tax=Sphingomonas flavida TaxID=3096154 RepID=UPI002FCB10EA
MAFPLHRFEEFGTLTSAEHQAITTLGDAPQAFKRHARIRGEDVLPTCFYLLVEGWVAAAQILPDGRRQILKIHLPGDALGTPSMCMARTVEDLTALTDVVVVPVSLKRFGTLFDTYPRIAARFLLSVQYERIALMDQLASMGRTSSEARLAAFLIDLFERLEPLGAVQGDSFDLKVTQEQMGDLLGLTSVHVNRMIRGLEKQGLISRSGHRMTLLSRQGLQQLAVRPVRQRIVDCSWLPKARSN